LKNNHQWIINNSKSIQMIAACLFDHEGKLEGARKNQGGCIEERELKP
jgi:hypothetical protein